jgi:CheY-like chemotaxis protein
MKDKRVLVVDDEQAVAEFVQTVVELEGGFAAIAASAAEALAHFRSGPPFDLLVLDLALPDISGWDLLESARDLMQGCKVVIFSAHLSDANQERARRTGVALSLVKPVGATALRDALFSVLRLPLEP